MRVQIAWLKCTNYMLCTGCEGPGKCLCTNYLVNKIDRYFIDNS